ncbi:hypothetical protein [Desulfogranum marinum]|uniref:hypothetical protein n=1 Tax=Desulfogranum marinum TaxID=453220 RepID=UPI0019629325|nr:hypothetical protein [Desulfogranum marinum]MBM9515261.1 hypothetical protein [Desulfogranum marinum]
MIGKKKMKNDQKSLDKEIKSRFSVEINGFIRRYPTSDHCMKEFWKWRGWKYDQRDEFLNFKCGNKECDGRKAYRKAIPNHPGNKHVVYQCEKCGGKVSEISDTVFRGMRKRHWVWFFSLFLMILLEGKKPYNYVANAFFDNQIDHPNKKTFPKINKNLHVVRKQSREVMNTLYERIFKGKEKERIIQEYSKFFGVSYSYSSFEEWYNANDDIRLPWKLAWCGTKAFIHKEIKNWVALEYGVPYKDIKLARAFKNAIKVKPGEWVLGFQEKKSGNIIVIWIYVEQILHAKDLIKAIEFSFCSHKLVEQLNNDIDSEEASKKCVLLNDEMNIVIHDLLKSEYKSQILHVNKEKWKLNPPFRLNEEFKNVFTDKISNWITENEDKNNTIFDLSDDFLNDMLMSIKRVRNY